VSALPDLFDAAYMQRALVEVLLLSVTAGVLGSWIVLRRLAFYTHAIGTAAFPGLVLAVPWGIPAQAAALGTALGFAGALDRLTRSGRAATDSATGLLLVGFFAVGVVLASDVFEAGAGVDRLLFGSLLGVSELDLWLTAAAAVGALALNAALWRPLLTAGFDPSAARALGVPATTADWLLLVAIACAAVVALEAVGALLVIGVLVMPAATVRLVARSVPELQIATAALAALQGVAGLWLAATLNVGPGPTISVLGGAVFAAAALFLAGRRRLAR